VHEFHLADSTQATRHYAGRFVGAHFGKDVADLEIYRIDAGKLDAVGRL
jgi:hypothetical protein